jgi:hypothetical protein
MSQIAKFVKKYLIIVDDKIWGCLKTIIAIHNYSTPNLFASIHYLFFLFTLALIWSFWILHSHVFISPSLGMFFLSCGLICFTCGWIGSIIHIFVFFNFFNFLVSSLLKSWWTLQTFCHCPSLIFLPSSYFHFFYN